MIWPLTGWWPAVVSSLVWPTSFAVVGWWGARLPAGRLAPGWLTRIRPWEDFGRTWHRLVRVRRWKDRVPDAGTLFGGASKATLVGQGRAGLPALRHETVRAERVHWIVLASSLVHGIWCPPGVLVWMVAFGMASNLPFIVIQRANRGRIERILARRHRS